MGACCSKDSSKKYVTQPSGKAEAPATEQQKQVPVWEKKKPDIKDFSFMKLEGETKVKEPGSIDGQQFIIENCVDCKLYVLDKTATVTIDDCKGCTIFLGPCESSVFIRDCSDCKVVLICRQFRTRDCKNLEVSLLCGSKPIIESSMDIRFGCFDAHYDGLEKHLKDLRFDPLRNFWSSVHDFTPAKGNFSLLAPDVTALSLLGGAAALPEGVACLAGAAAAEGNPPAVFVTYGERPPLSPEGCFVLLPPPAAGRAREVVDAARAAGLTLSRANSADLDEDLAASLVAKTRVEEARAITASAAVAAQGAAERAKALRGGKSVGMEFQGPGGEAALKALVEGMGGLFLPGADGCVEYRFLGIDG